ncbi:hypothetical protein [Amycolatopsis anabasis]|uniref:hypothetical protein n=1 Tax=Amycolatopsis anabasis TaxID=1840409 RepID=UPI00131D3D55|nr:hypothetical protein [Amycolatopsis anabasis]
MARRRDETVAAAARERVTKHHVSRIAMLAGPWAGMVPVFFAGVGSHALWGGSSELPWMSAAASVIVLLFTWLAVRTSRGWDRSAIAVGHAAVTTVLIGGWITMAMITGVWEWTGAWTPGVLRWLIPTAVVVPLVVGLLTKSWQIGTGFAVLLCVGTYCFTIVRFVHPTIDLWLILAVLVGLSWNIRLAAKGDGDSAAGPGKLGRQLMASLGMAGSDLRVQRHDENRVTAALELAPGEQTAADAQGVREKLAGAVGIPTHRVTMVPDDEDPNRVETTLMLRDVLKHPIPWPGPSRPGGTVFEPYIMGVCSDGTASEKYVAMVEGTEQELEIGTTGSGKTMNGLVEVAEAISRRESATIVIDFVKGIMNFGCLAAGLYKFIVDRPTAERFFRELPRAIKRRGNYLGSRGYTEWRPGCGLTFLTVRVEEASFLVDFANIDQVAKAARQVGIRLIWSTQRPIHTEMSTVLRAMLTTTTCYGVGDDFDTGVLPEDVEAAGADPFKWKNTRRGYHYLIQGGMDVPLRKKAMPRRGFRPYSEAEAAREGLTGKVLTLDQHARSCNPDPLDDVTVDSFGAWFRNLPAPLEVVRAQQVQFGWLADDTTDRIPAPQQVPPPREPDDPAGSGEQFGESYEEAVEQDGAAGGTEVEDPAPEVKTDMETPLPDSPADIQFGSPGDGPECSTEEVRKMVADRIAELEQSGRETVRPRDFASLYNRPKSKRIRSHGWFSKELRKLEKAGRLRYDAQQGAYVIQPAEELAKA